jgi:hypothetical protein
MSFDVMHVILPLLGVGAGWLLRSRSEHPLQAQVAKALETKRDRELQAELAGLASAAEPKK